jgi:hypothetical protein
MSKLVTQRFEYAAFDNTALSNVPPTYPQALDTYQAGYAATVAEAYGIVPVNSLGPVVALGIPAGATCVIVGDAANTAPVVLSQPALQTAPSAASAAVNIVVQPNQIVTLPGVLNAGGLMVQGMTTAQAPTTAVPFAAQILWSL